jgi:molybdate transport system substrate-binding protein
VSTLRVFSTLALQGCLGDVMAAFTADTGCSVDAIYAPTRLLQDRIAGGDRPDVALLTAEAATELHAAGRLSGPPVAVAVSSIGIAVAAGQATAGIGSIEALTAFLREVPSIAYSRSGASGIFFADLLDRLGLRALVDAKAVVVASGFTGERVVSGEVVCAVQQISELLFVEGIGPVAALPDEAQSRAVFSAVVLAERATRDAAALVGFLTGPGMRTILRSWGLAGVGLAE